MCSQKSDRKVTVKSELHISCKEPFNCLSLPNSTVNSCWRRSLTDSIFDTVGYRGVLASCWEDLHA